MASKLQGTILEIDPSGDLITSLAAEQLSAAQAAGLQARVECDEHETFGIFDSIEGLASMTFAAVIDPARRLRLTLTGDSAADLLRLRPGQSVTVTWP